MVWPSCPLLATNAFMNSPISSLTLRRAVFHIMTCTAFGKTPSACCFFFAARSESLRGEWLRCRPTVKQCIDNRDRKYRRYSWSGGIIGNIGPFWNASDEPFWQVTVTTSAENTFGVFGQLAVRSSMFTTSTMLPISVAFCE